jgi:hypothetical protein
MNKSGFDSRIEFRIDSDTKEEVISFCSSKNLDISEFCRDALNNRMKEKKLTNLIIRYLQKDNFFNIFRTFYHQCPPEIAIILESMVGFEEEKLIEQMPNEFLSSIKVISEKGKKALDYKMTILERKL